MASRLRPTPETGVVAATQQPASSIGPSWRDRAGRNARLAMRDAIRRGDRKEAMGISMAAEEAGLPAQAQIRSAESRVARDFQTRGVQAATLAEQQAALDAAQGEQMTPEGIPDPTGEIAARRAIKDQVEQGRTGGMYTMEKRVSPGQPAAPEAPTAPGASQTPENPVTGATKPPVADVRTRLAERGSKWQPVKQGLAGRQEFDRQLQQSIERGGRDISAGRFNNMLTEATRLGVSREQLLTRLQDFGGVSLPKGATGVPDNRSLDERMRSYQDRYLGGGPASELTSRLRESAASGRRTAAAIRQPAAAAQAPAAATPAEMVAPPAEMVAPPAASWFRPESSAGSPRSAASMLGGAVRSRAIQAGVSALQPALAAQREARENYLRVGQVQETLQAPVLAAAAAGSALRSNAATALGTARTSAEVLLERARRNRESWRRAAGDFAAGLRGTR